MTASLRNGDPVRRRSLPIVMTAGPPAEEFSVPHSGPDRLSRFGLLAVSIVLVSIVLRGPLVAVGSLAGPLASDTGLSAAAVGALLSLPVVLFGLAAPLALLAVRYAGPHLAATLFLAGVAGGAFVRSVDSEVALFTGSVLLGVAICVGNVVVPVLIRAHAAPARAGALMGINTAAANIGSMLGASAAVPLADLVGWRGSLASWGLTALLVGAAWVLLAGSAALRPQRRDPVARLAEVPPAVIDGPRRRGRPQLALFALLTLALAGQSFSYYGITSWLPSYLHHALALDAAAAGGIASIFQIMGVAGGLVTPFLLQRTGPLPTGMIVGVFWIALPVGLLADPALWLPWCLLGGYAQGAGFVIIFTLLIRSSASPAHAARMSASVQTFAYAAGAAAPTVVGAVYETTAGWGLPFALLVGSTGVFATAVCAAAVLVRLSQRDR